MKKIALLYLTLLTALNGVGCTFPIVNASIRNVSQSLQPGASRANVIQTLGTPRQSKTFKPMVSGNTFVSAPVALQHARVSIYDEYRLNGLTFTSRDNPYAGFGMGYTMGMYLTLGLGEIIYFPYYMVDLSVRSNQRYQLRLWYDDAGRLIAEDNRRESTH